MQAFIKGQLICQKLHLGHLLRNLSDPKSHRLQGVEAAGLARRPQTGLATAAFLQHQRLHGDRLKEGFLPAKLFLHTCKSSSKFVARVMYVPTKCAGTRVEADFCLRNSRGAHAGTALHVTKTSCKACSQFLLSTTALRAGLQETAVTTADRSKCLDFCKALS